MRVRVMVIGLRRATRADAFDVVMMAVLRLTDPGFEADDLLAIEAGQAVHVVITGRDAIDPVDEGVYDKLMGAQIRCLDELDPRVCGGDLVGNPIDPLNRMPVNRK